MVTVFFNYVFIAFREKKIQEKQNGNKSEN